MYSSLEKHISKVLLETMWDMRKKEERRLFTTQPDLAQIFCLCRFLLVTKI